VVHATLEALSVVVHATLEEEVDSRQHTDLFPAVQYQHHHCDQILQSQSDMEVDDEDTGPITSNNSKTSTVNIMSEAASDRLHTPIRQHLCLVCSTYLCMRPMWAREALWNKPTPLPGQVLLEATESG